MLRAALKTFPHVRHHTMAGVQQTAATVCALTVHSDREISVAAGMALQEVVMLSLDDNLIPVLYAYMDVARNLDLADEEYSSTLIKVPLTLIAPIITLITLITLTTFLRPHLNS